MSVPFSKRWVEAVPERVHRDPLAQPGSGAGRAAGCMQNLHVDRLRLIAAGEQPRLGPSQAPVRAQDAEQLGREHHGAVLAALAALDPDHHPHAVDVGDLQTDRLGRPQSRRIGRRQRDAGLQARHRFENAHHLVGVQDHRQLARLARVGDALRDLALPKRDAIEEPQRADRLVQRRPRHAGRHQMNLEGADVLQAKPVRGPAEVAAELADRVQIGSLRRRRQIADGHVLGHAAALRADLGHRGAPVSRIALRQIAILSDRSPLSYPLTPLPRERVRSNLFMSS